MILEAIKTLLELRKTIKWKKMRKVINTDIQDGRTKTSNIKNCDKIFVKNPTTP